MKAPRVSVILTSFNNGKYLGEAIDSILAQEFGDYELILVDDGSEDDSVEIIQYYHQKDSRIRSVILDCNTGAAGARNRGFDIAHGEYIAYMDSDDVSLPTRLQNQVDFLDKTPEVGAVGVRVQRKNHDLSISGSIRKCPADHGRIALNIFNGSNLHVLAGTMMIRRELLKSVGGWDETVRHNIEKGFLASLLFYTKCRFANLTETLYFQRVHDNNMSSTAISRDNFDAMVDVRRQLRRLWGGVCDDALRRFRDLQENQRLSWNDRRLAKKDMNRIIETLVERDYVRPGDRPLMEADMNRRLERASPRRWQQFCHWRRKWIGSRD